MAQERVFDQKNSMGPGFNQASERIQPTGRIHTVPLGKEMIAIYTRSDSHTNREKQGKWEKLEIKTPKGTFQFDNEEALKQRTKALADNNHPYAPAFEKALKTYQRLNEAGPMVKPDRAAYVAAKKELSFKSLN